MAMNVLAMIAIIGIVVILLGVVFRIRPAEDRARGHRPRDDRRRHRGPPLRRDPDEPSIRIGRLIFCLLLSPIVLFVWLIASLGDLIEAAVHLLVACLSVVFGLIDALFSRRASGHWKTAGKEIRGLGRTLYTAGRRFVEYFGLGGFVDRVEEGLRAAGRGAVVGTASTAANGADVRPPDTLAFEDRYRVESHLTGGGSTAKLFVVRRLERDRPVGDQLVLKYFDMGLGSRLEELMRESRGMRVAREMGIVLDHDLGADYFYYVMPYYEGETLTGAAARIHRRLLSGQGLENQDLDTLLDWMGQTLRILDAYHRRGVIHKDVKPDNLIVTEEGVRLVDLGLMTPIESALTLTTHGTEYFRDPEMVKLAVAGKRVRDVDAARFDIYSAGAVLYLLVEGSFPACGPLSRFSRPVPMALGTITSRAMAEGAKRYENIAAMRADLEAFREMMRTRDPSEIPVSALPSFRGMEDLDGAYAEAGAFAGASAPGPAPEPAPPPPPPVAPPVESRHERSRHGAPIVVAVLVLLSLTAIFAVLLMEDEGESPSASARTSILLESEAAELEVALRRHVEAGLVGVGAGTPGMRNLSVALVNRLQANPRLESQYVTWAATAFRDGELDVETLWKTLDFDDESPRRDAFLWLAPRRHLLYTRDDVISIPRLGKAADG